MEYRNLGRSGLKVSVLSFGAWDTFGGERDESERRKCLKTVIDAGVNFLDNAESYGGGSAEVQMGRLIKKMGLKRSDLILSTKIFWGGTGPNDRGLSRKHIVEGTDAALGRLQADYVDLVFCHRPDTHTPVEETVRAMHHVVTSGRAFYWGTSEWSAEQLRHAHAIAEREHLIGPTMEQPQYNMLHRDRVERELLPLYRDYGLGLTVWSPLASGLLTGKYNDGMDPGGRLAKEEYGWLRDRLGLGTEKGESALRRIRRICKLAGELDCTPAQLALAWCARNPHVSTVITGASRQKQAIENMGSLAVVAKLTPEVLQQIEDILENHPGTEADWRKA